MKADIYFPTTGSTKYKANERFLFFKFRWLWVARTAEAFRTRDDDISILRDIVMYPF